MTLNKMNQITNDPFEQRTIIETTLQKLLVGIVNMIDMTLVKQFTIDFTIWDQNRMHELSMNLVN